MKLRTCTWILAAALGAGCPIFTQERTPPSGPPVTASPGASAPATTAAEATAPKPILDASGKPAAKSDAPVAAQPASPPAVPKAPAHPTTPPAPSDAPAFDTSDFIATSSGLKYKVLQEGTGPKPMIGQYVRAHYTGWLTNGKKFDSSLDRGQPYSFNVGLSQVIAGWDEAILDMKVGEKRKLVIPPALGYRNHKMGEIPPNSTLVFEVELVAIQQR